MRPIDLEAVSVGRFRMGLDEAAAGEPGGRKDPWYRVILCRHGQIYPYSDKLLAAHVKGYAARRKLASIVGVILQNWSDDGEAIFLFPPDRFEAVAGIVKPRRKRRLGVTQRQKATGRLRAYHFRPKSTYVDAEKGSENGPISVKPIFTGARW